MGELKESDAMETEKGVREGRWVRIESVVKMVVLVVVLRVLMKSERAWVSERWPVKRNLGLKYLDGLSEMEQAEVTRLVMLSEILMSEEGDDEEVRHGD